MCVYLRASHLHWKLLPWLRWNTGHEIIGDKSPNSHRALAGRHVGRRVAVKVQGQQNDRHLADVAADSRLLQDRRGDVIGLTQRAQHALGQEGGCDVFDGELDRSSKYVHHPENIMRNVTSSAPGDFGCLTCVCVCVCVSMCLYSVYVWVCVCVCMHA